MVCVVNVPEMVLLTTFECGGWCPTKNILNNARDAEDDRWWAFFTWIGTGVFGFND